MAGKYFPIVLRKMDNTLVDAAATLHFDPLSSMGTGEKAELTTCLKAKEGAVLHAVSRSRTKERYWEIKILPDKPHQNGNHSCKHKVEITAFHETPLSKK